MAPGACAAFDHGGDVGFHCVVIAAAQRADVYHHVDFLRARAQGGFGFGDLRFGGRRAQRKADHGADLDRRSGQLGRNQRHPVGIDADAGETILARLAADLEDVIARGFGRRMVWSMSEAMEGSIPVSVSLDESRPAPAVMISLALRAQVCGQRCTQPGHT